MKFKLTIDIAGAALTEDLPAELCDILDRLNMALVDEVPPYNELQSCECVGELVSDVVQDTNGNTVGHWEITA